MNLTKVATVVLLCLAFLSVAYGFSVALSTSLNTKVAESHTCVDAHETYHQLFAYGRHNPSPKGDPIDNPKPN